MATMREVAALAGVSAKTVSRVFNDEPYVTAETRLRVEEAMRELSYVPNSVATTLRTGRSSVIGIAVPDLVDPFFAAIAMAVNRLALQHGMSTVVACTGEDPEQEVDVVGRLLSHAPSGLIIAPVTGDHAYLRPWKDRLPIVFVDRAPVRLAADSLTVDDVGGARTATQHLVDHGHRRIAFVGASPAVPTVRQRLQGYREALSDNGLPERERYEALDSADAVAAQSAVRELLALPAPPTAVMSSNAQSTMALLPALRRTELALVGFGDFPMADLLDPAVTVIDQDPTGIGTQAGRRVLDRLAHPGRRYRRHMVSQVRLVERESCRMGGAAARRRAGTGTARSAS